jgi:hypothetical protein
MLVILSSESFVLQSSLSLIAKSAWLFVSVNLQLDSKGRVETACLRAYGAASLFGRQREKETEAEKTA